jgi:hypothetical protein
MLIITDVITTLVQTRPHPQSTDRSVRSEPRLFGKVGVLAVMVGISADPSRSICRQQIIFELSSIVYNLTVSFLTHAEPLLMRRKSNDRIQWSG